MNPIREYLFLSFCRLFFIFFIVLFFISSVIVLIGIAGVTFVIKINFIDLLQLYLYSLPNSVFFILPISFFVASCLTLSKLSYDYELLILFSLGISPNAIVKTFLPINILLTLILLVLSLALVPLSSSSYKNFISEKKSSIDVNIKSGEFGQKLGNWLVYVDNASNREYENLILFSSEGSSEGVGLESFILAKRGKANNANNIFEINLFDGASYFARNYDIKKIVFENMIVRSAIGEPVLKSYNLYSYWSKSFLDSKSKEARVLSQSILVSLFPLSSIFLFPLFGIANPRFQKNLSYLYITIAILIFYTFTYLISNNIPFLGILIFIPLWFCIGFFLYRKFILRFY